MRVVFISLCFYLLVPGSQPYSIFTKDTPTKSPVIFIPGDGGSQMDAILDKPSTVHYICQKKTKDYFNLWLNLELLVPLVIDCWIDNIKLVYDNATRTTSNPVGVTTRVPGWGNPEVVEWLDPTHAYQGSYFKDIANALVQNGYVRNISIRGAPFDFRKGPNENAQWFIDLKTLVEETYSLNADVPITFIAHSMGAPMITLFLQRQTNAWKSKYVARIMTLCGAYGGSAKAIKVYALGDDLGAFALRASVMRPGQITSPSLAWLLPNPLFWKPDEVLVKTKSRNYTMAQVQDYLIDVGVPNGWEMRKDVLKFTDFTAPNVEVHCLYGSNVPTVEMLHYKKSDNFDETPDLINGDGDGTVNARSLQGCVLWRPLQKPSITTLELPGVDHMHILSDTRVISYILNVLVPN